jgi:hypothetical protein
MDSDGKIKDIDKLKDVIFRGVNKGRYSPNTTTMV